MITINDLTLLNPQSLSEINLNPNLKLDKECFDWISTSETRIVFTDMKCQDFKGVIGLMESIHRDGVNLKGNLHVYDVNGFDTELPDFLEEGLSTNGLVIRPLIKTLTVEENVVKKADIVCFRLLNDFKRGDE